MTNTPDAWFANELHHLLVNASERGISLTTMVDTLLIVVGTATAGQPTHQKAELLMRFALHAGLDMEISIEPRAPNRPC